MKAAGRARMIGGAVALAFLLPGNPPSEHVPAAVRGPDVVAAAPVRSPAAVPVEASAAPPPTTPPPAAPPRTATRPAPTAPPPRWPGHTFVAGDSLTATSLSPDDPGPGAPADLAVAAGMGWTARHVQEHLDLAQLDRRIDTLVVALATNDSSPLDGGWADDDEADFRRLVGSVDDGACVVIVLPGHAPTADLARVAEMAEARLALWAIADERRQDDGYGPTVVVDWQDRVDDRPDLVAPDGIHLAASPGTFLATPEASAWRTSLYWEGAAACTRAGA